MLVVDGGATMNPSTYELLAGIHAAPGAEVRGAAEQPERDPGRRARGRAVREARAGRAHHGAAGGAGRAAGVRPDRRAATRTPTRWREAADALRIGGVAPAARDDAQGRFAAGDAVGYAGGELVAWGDPADTLAATLASAGRRRRARHLHRRRRRPAGSRATSRRTCPDGVELEYHEGGQPAWWWLLCAE